MNTTIIERQRTEPPALEKLQVIPGEVKVNHGVVLAASDQLSAVLIDLATKRADVFCTEVDEGVPVILLCASDETLHVEESLRGTPTILRLEAFKGFNIWMSEVSRYTLRLTLIRGDSA